MNIKNILEIVPALGVIVTALALCYQILQSRFSMKLDLVLKLDDKFNSIEIKKIRAKIAKMILDEGQIDNFKGAEDVFNLFEDIGYLVKHKAIDKKIVWHTFYVWLHGYWSVGKTYIYLERIDKKDETLWKSFQWLHNELLKIERVKTKKHEPEQLTQKEIIDFFENEPKELQPS